MRTVEKEVRKLFKNYIIFFNNKIIQIYRSSGSEEVKTSDGGKVKTYIFKVASLSSSPLQFQDLE